MKMKIRVLKVSQKKYEEVEVLHIYPNNNTQIHLYRRKDNGNIWTHFLGDNTGWLVYPNPWLYEEAYQIFQRNKKQEQHGK